MSYEEDYRIPYKASCACGRGFVRYYLIIESNDWGQTRESKTNAKIHCDYCKENYYFFSKPYEGEYLIPNGISFAKEIPKLNPKYQPSDNELFVLEHSRDELEAMILDMEKNRFMARLKYTPSIRFAYERYSLSGKKALKPLINYLRSALTNYDIYLTSYSKKKPYYEEYTRKLQEQNKKEYEATIQSFRLDFEIDTEQELLDKKQAQLEHEEYTIAHKYDDFQARVVYHKSYKVDSTGHYWDTLFILQCVDPQYLVLEKPQYGNATIKIVKKYLCRCSICGKEFTVNSSDFEILQDEEKGYYPAVQCDCHSVSSFEAKAMDILNKLGIEYIREFSFDELVGDNGVPLRFDFAILSDDSVDEIGASGIQLLLELQGPHHYKTGLYDEYGSFVEALDDSSNPASTQNIKQVRYDLLKQNYCRQKGIALETIKYTGSSYNKLKEQLEKIVDNYNIL